jgi:circadian clock protein KaiC
MTGLARLRSGAAGLDEVLHGGLPVNAINLVAGVPGTGKTLLAQQCVFTNAASSAPAVYVSTVSEPFEKIVRYGQTMRFFDPDAVGRSVFYEDLGDALDGGGVGAALERLEHIINDHEPSLLVIDSFKPLATLAESTSQYRRFVHELGTRLTIRPITSLWLGEYSGNELATSPEFAVADVVIWLSTGRYEEREVRLLQILKLRGSGFRSGRHAYRLSDAGMRVFPRLADPAEATGYTFDTGRVSSGVNALDNLLGDGLRRGSSTLVIGPSGIGKTVLGLQFAFEGVRSGDATVFATFDENPSQLTGAAAGFGWSMGAPEMHLLYRSAVDLHLDEWVYELLELIAAHDVRRVFIDGLGHLRAAAHDPLRFLEYLYSLVQRFARRGVTLMMSVESPELFGVVRLADIPLSQMGDNVLILQFVRRENDYRRGITLLKSRAAKTEPRLSEFTIDRAGIKLDGGGQRDRRR